MRTEILQDTFGLLLEIDSVGELVELAKLKSTLTDLMYHHKVLVIRGLGELTTDQLWDVHALFGTPWSRHDNAMSVKETVEHQSFNKNVAYFGTDIYNKVVNQGSLTWHRDIPWHREIRYPIRSLYAHETYKTPTLFADCDILMSGVHKPSVMDVDIQIQYWYYRQYDTREKRHKVLTKYVPLVETHEYTKRQTPLLNSFSLERSQEMRSQYPYMSSFQAAWILGASIKGVPLGESEYLGLFSYLHTLVCNPERLLTWHYQKHDLVLFDNASGVFHSRENVAEEDGKRSFYRMNVRHPWQTERARDL